MFQFAVGAAFVYKSADFFGAIFGQVIIVHQNFELSETVHFFEAVAQVPEQDVAGRGCDLRITHVDRERV